MRLGLLSSAVPAVRTRENGLTLGQRKFRLDTRKKIFMIQEVRLFMEVVESLPPEVFKRLALNDVV